MEGNHLSGTSFRWWDSYAYHWKPNCQWPHRYKGKNKYFNLILHLFRKHTQQLFYFIFYFFAFQYKDRMWPVIILGALMFIPGAYHVRVALMAYRKVPGYSFDDIPEFE